MRSSRLATIVASLACRSCGYPHGIAVPAESRPESLRIGGDDVEIADWLDVSLESNGFAPTLDRHGISGAENWEQRLGARSAAIAGFLGKPAVATAADTPVDSAPRPRRGRNQ